MVNPIQRVGNDPRKEWATVNSSFGHWQPPKGPQSLPYPHGPYGETIGPDMHDNYASSYINRLPVNHAQISLDEVSNEVVDFFPGSNGLAPVQQPGTSPVIGPEDYDKLFNAFLNLPQPESHDHIHDTGSQPDLPYLEYGNAGFGATAQMECDDALRTTIPSMSNEEFAQRMAALNNNSWPPLGTIAQPQPGNGEPYVNQLIFGKDGPMIPAQMAL